VVDSVSFHERRLLWVEVRGTSFFYRKTKVTGSFLWIGNGHAWGIWNGEEGMHPAAGWDRGRPGLVKEKKT
jgi:hypothetical protein